MSERPSPAAESVAASPPAEQRRGGFPELGRFWTWANVLTLSRFLLVPPIAWLVYEDGPLGWLVVLILLAVATDFFDGKVARRMGTVSEWGKVLDPLADKVAAAAVTLAVVIRPVEPTLDAWFVLLVIVRDVVIAAGGALQTHKLGYVLMALWTGKVAVNLLALTIVSVLLRFPQLMIDVLVALTVVTLLYSMGQYLYRFAQVMRLGPAVPLDESHNVVRERLPETNGP